MTTTAFFISIVVLFAAVGVVYWVMSILSKGGRRMTAYFTPLLLSRLDNLILIWLVIWLVLSLLLWGWFCWKCLPREFSEDS